MIPLTTAPGALIVANVSTHHPIAPNIVKKRVYTLRSWSEQVPGFLDVVELPSHVGEVWVVFSAVAFDLAVLPDCILAALQTQPARDSVNSGG